MLYGAFPRFPWIPLPKQHHLVTFFFEIAINVEWEETFDHHNMLLNLSSMNCITNCVVLLS